MRKFFTYTFILFCLGLANPLNAQKKTAALNPAMFRHITRLSFSDDLNLTLHKEVNLNIFPLQKNVFLPIKAASVKDLPFFCALEYRVQQHTKLWIKLRAGNDESYMKMIRSTEK